MILVLMILTIISIFFLNIHSNLWIFYLLGIALSSLSIILFYVGGKQDINKLPILGIIVLQIGTIFMLIDLFTNIYWKKAQIGSIVLIFLIKLFTNESTVVIDTTSLILLAIIDAGSSDIDSLRSQISLPFIQIVIGVFGYVIKRYEWSRARILSKRIPPTYKDISKFTCPTCGEKCISSFIGHSLKKPIYQIVLKCPIHKNEITIPENDIKYYIEDIVKSTLTCKHCGISGSEIKTEDHQIYTFGFRQFKLGFEIFCLKCRKRSYYSISINLYSLFYENYFDILKKQFNSKLITENREDILCSKCKNSILARKIQFKNRMVYIKGICLGSEHHHVKMQLELDQYNWLNLLPKIINVCKNCGSTDLLIRELNFKYSSSEHTTEIPYRVIIQTCNKCGTKNKSLLGLYFYQIYRRALRETKIKPYEGKTLFCTICGSKSLLGKVELKRNVLQAILYCEKGHFTNKILALDRKNVWINTILSGVKICKNCFSPNVRVKLIALNYSLLRQIKSTKIKLECLDCKKRRDIVINNLIFDEMMDFLFNE